MRAYVCVAGAAAAVEEREWAGERRHCSWGRAAGEHCSDRTAQAAVAGGMRNVCIAHAVGAGADGADGVDDVVDVVDKAGFRWDIGSQTADVLTAMVVVAAVLVLVVQSAVAGGVEAGGVIVALASALGIDAAADAAAAGLGCRMPRREASCQKAK